MDGWRVSVVCGTYGGAIGLVMETALRDRTDGAAKYIVCN